MYRDDASLNDAYNAGKKVLKYAEGLTKKELEGDEIRVNAITYQVIVIGEATMRLSSEFRESHPEIPWKRMVGMRNILAHQYDRIDFETLWNAITISLPDALAKIEPLVS